MANGQVSPPVGVPGALALIRLRGLVQGGEIEPRAVTVDYARLRVAGGGGAAATAVRDRIDSCDDLYPIAKGQPAGTLLRETRSLAEVPAGIASELARLDDNEAALMPDQGGGVTILMLCRRTATVATNALDQATVDALVAAETAAAAGSAAVPFRVGDVPRLDPALGFGRGPTRQQLREELLNQRLGGLAEGHLARLRAEAIIRRP
jgi:peptidyl-prolyl cis-trans isomerase SurA